MFGFFLNDDFLRIKVISKGKKEVRVVSMLEKCEMGIKKRRITGSEIRAAVFSSL